MDGEDLGNDKDDDTTGPSGAPSTETSNMEVDSSAPSSSHGQGKSVPVSHVLCPAITPYNASPKTPRGKEIVDRIRRVSPQLVGRSAVSPLELVVPVASQEVQGTPGVYSSPPWRAAAQQVEPEERGPVSTPPVSPLSTSTLLEGRPLRLRLPLLVLRRWLRGLLHRLCPLPWSRLLRWGCRWRRGV
jgi:hypothetical protein